MSLLPVFFSAIAIGSIGCSRSSTASNDSRAPDTGVSVDASASSVSDSGTDAARDAIDASAEIDASTADDLPADAPFEGAITITVNGNLRDAQDERNDLELGKSKPLLTITSKGKDAWWPLDASGGGVRLYKGEPHTLFTIPTGDRAMYAADVTKITKSLATHTWKLDVVSHVGAIQKIPCERWRTSDDNYRYEVCAAKGLTPVPFQVMGPPWSDVLPFNGELMKLGLFPLSAFRTPLTRPKADPTTLGPRIQLQVTSVARRRVPQAQVILPERVTIPRDSLFLPPPLLK